MSPWYRLMYRIGFTPWERTGQRAGDVLDTFLRREGLSPGRALDVGCGSGRHSVELAQLGWDVTGVDLVPLALERARRRAEEAGVAVDFVHADVTREGAVLGDGFDLVIDFGCFHGLGDTERAGYGHTITAATRPDAQLLMFAFGPGRHRGPLPRGAERADLERALPQWSVAGESGADLSEFPPPLRRMDPRWFHVKRSVKEKPE